MNTFKLTQLVCCLSFITLFNSCDSQNTSHLTDQDHEYFKNVYIITAKSWNEGNRGPYLDNYTDKTLRMMPNQPYISGLKAIAEHVNAMPNIKVKFNTEEIWGTGTDVNVRGGYEISDDDANLLSKGKFINLWKRDEGGSWKITHEIWNSDLPEKNSIEGGWYLISGEYSGDKRGGTEPFQFKLFSDKHFALLMQTKEGEWKNSITGSYSLSENIFTESIEFSNQPEYVGMTVDWNYEVKGDTLMMEGPLRILNEEGKEVEQNVYNTMKEIRIRAK